jgi:hypothetical protein
VPCAVSPIDIFVDQSPWTVNIYQAMEAFPQQLVEWTMSWFASNRWNCSLVY